MGVAQKVEKVEKVEIVRCEMLDNGAPRPWEESIMRIINVGGGNHV